MRTNLSESIIKNLKESEQPSKCYTRLLNVLITKCNNLLDVTDNKGLDDLKYGDSKLSDYEKENVKEICTKINEEVSGLVKDIKSLPNYVDELNDKEK